MRTQTPPGFAGSTTTVQVANESLVTILRTGTANSNLTLETGQKSISACIRHRSAQ